MLLTLLILLKKILFPTDNNYRSKFQPGLKNAQYILAGVFCWVCFKYLWSRWEGIKTRSIGKNFVREEVMVMSFLVVNFCKQEEMSICTASTKNQQTGCSFYEKSSFAERCMYYIFDEYCDSLKAQMNARIALASWTIEGLRAVVINSLQLKVWNSISGSPDYGLENFFARSLSMTYMHTSLAPCSI
jgi:hypothetical protein